MIVGIPRENFPGERRVSIIASFVERIKKLELDALKCVQELVTAYREA